MGMATDDPLWRANAHAWFESRLGDPSYGIFVVTADERVVASAMGCVRDAAPSPTSPDGGDVLVSNVCTAPAHRGRGHGRAAFDAVMAWARTQGVGRAELMATEAGRRMYESAGFEARHAPVMRAPLR